jgi:transposase InsO family protein
MVKRKRKNFFLGPRHPHDTHRRNYPSDYKIKAVRLHLDEGISQSVVSEQIGIGSGLFSKWVRKYQKQGPSCFDSIRSQRRSGKIPAAVQERIVALKQSEPRDGSHRISDLLRRMFFMKASPETVRRILHKEALLPPTPRPKTKKKHAVQHAAVDDEGGSYVKGPHLMWQSDISVITWKKQSIYLIGFIDDFSRFVTGLGLYMTQKADNVLEVLRRAAVEYTPPKEMLTDNGRQYTSWRGKAQFEKEMIRMQIRHIRSQPHHPQTQGKIERFWKTIKEEFFSRTLFDGFEDMQNRTKLWIQYYNFKRPHQGIGGLCPADRFYEVSHDVRKVVENGIAENILQMALVGAPRKPCYLVGRMDDQSVTVMAEQGRLKLSVSDLAGRPTQEMIYPLSIDTKINDITEGSVPYGKVSRDDESQAQSIVIDQCGGEMPGGAVGVDGEAQAGGNMPGAFDKMDNPDALAKPRLGGNAAGAGTSSEPGDGSSALAEAADTSCAPGEESAVPIGGNVAEPSGITPGGHSCVESGECQQPAEGVGHDGRPCTGAGEDYHAGLWGHDVSGGGSAAFGRLPQDVLRVGEPRTPRHVGGDGGPGSGAAADSIGRCGEGGAEAGAGRGPERDLRCPGVALCPACAGRVRSEACGGCPARR